MSACAPALELEMRWLDAGPTLAPWDHVHVLLTSASPPAPVAMAPAVRNCCATVSRAYTRATSDIRSPSHTLKTNECASYLEHFPPVSSVHARRTYDTQGTLPRIMGLHRETRNEHTQ
eukprot:scaffold8697_cov33-Tisochrysis_lutea.AAC.7